MSYRVLGTDDSVSTCDCCGRSDLKSTVALEDETGDVMHFGVVCAARATKRPTNDIRNDARTADKARRDAEQSARDVAHRMADARWQTFLDGRAPGLERINQIAKLGGMAAARAAYQEMLA